MCPTTNRSAHGSRVICSKFIYTKGKTDLLITFGARKRRSTNQALTLLQEHAYQMWRMVKVLSLASFDVKGARDTAKHFLFRYSRWDNLRQGPLSQTKDKRMNLSLFMGGKTCQDSAEWAADMEAVYATIRFALRSKRLEDSRDIMYPA